MVVVAIIVILISILVPSVSAAKRLGQTATCASNLRQIGMGMSAYVVSTGGYLPGSYGADGNGAIATWPVRIRNAMTGNNLPTAQAQNLFYCPAAPLGWAWQVKAGTGSGYATAVDIGWGYNSNFKYNGVTGGEVLVDGTMISFSYGYNDWGSYNTAVPQRGLGGDQWSHPPVRADHVLNQTVFAIGDTSAADNAWGQNIDPTNPLQYPGTRHNNGSNMLCFDGHVEWHLQNAIILCDTSGNMLATTSAIWQAVAPWWNNDGKP